MHTKLKFELSDLDDALRQQIEQLEKRVLEFSRKVDELMKAHNEKKTILNIPTSFDDDPKRKKKLDEEFILDAFEKMRDYIAQEMKKIRDEMFKQHYEFETRVREKIDKKELEEIEST